VLRIPLPLPVAVQTLPHTRAYCRPTAVEPPLSPTRTSLRGYDSEDSCRPTGFLLACCQTHSKLPLCDSLCRGGRPCWQNWQQAPANSATGSASGGDESDPEEDPVGAPVRIVPTTGSGVSEQPPATRTPRAGVELAPGRGPGSLRSSLTFALTPSPVTSPVPVGHARASHATGTVPVSPLGSPRTGQFGSATVSGRTIHNLNEASSRGPGTGMGRMVIGAGVASGLLSGGQPEAAATGTGSVHASATPREIAAGVVDGLMTQAQPEREHASATGRRPIQPGAGAGAISLALSGGGIRAGAVATGVLCYLEGSGLADNPGIDTISCVSGGGYAGASYTLWSAEARKAVAQPGTSVGASVTGTGGTTQVQEIMQKCVPPAFFTIHCQC
jgi:hypothetical protein